MLSGKELGKLAYENWGKYGVPVFPCGDDKRPLGKWRDIASTDEQAIIDMFDAKGTRARLIGAAMGEESRLFALDFDLYKGPSAQEYMQTLMMAKLLPKTRIHQTKSGGVHYLYTLPDGQTMPRNSVPHDGVEIRGEGGYIIVPPSKGYTVQLDEVVADAPAALVSRIKRADAAFKSLSISGLTEKVIAGETFHEALTAIAAKMHSNGDDPADVTKALTDAMMASVASNPHHERHDRWLKIMQGADGELARISASAYNKFNPRKDQTDVRQVVKKMGAARGNRAVTLGGFFMDKPGDDEKPERGTFGVVKKTKENTKAPAGFPFERSYTAAKVDDEDNKSFIIYPLLMEGDVVVLSAAPKAGKTLTAMTICLHAAAGLAMGESLVPMNKEGKTAPVPVIYFALEGQGAIRKRVKAWVLEQRAQGHKVDEDSLRLYVVEQSLNLTENEAKQVLVDKLLAADAWFKSLGWGDLGVVVFDTLTKAMPGKDQNSVEDTSAVFHTVDMMREVGLQCSVFFIHHNNKTGNSPRGSGNIMAEPDTVLSVNKLEQVVENGTPYDCYQLSVFMARAVDDDQSYKFKASSIEIGVNSQGIMETAPVLSLFEDYDAAPTVITQTIKKAASMARDQFYEVVWTLLSDSPGGRMTYGKLHRSITKGNTASAAFYGQHLNGSGKASVKAAWTTLLHKEQLPTELSGMQFEVGEEGVALILGGSAPVEMKEGRA